MNRITSICMQTVLLVFMLTSSAKAGVFSNWLNTCYAALFKTATSSSEQPDMFRVFPLSGQFNQITFQPESKSRTFYRFTHDWLGRIRGSSSTHDSTFTISKDGKIIFSGSPWPITELHGVIQLLRSELNRRAAHQDIVNSTWDSKQDYRVEPIWDKFDFLRSFPEHKSRTSYAFRRDWLGNIWVSQNSEKPAFTIASDGTINRLNNEWPVESVEQAVEVLRNEFKQRRERITYINSTWGNPPEYRIQPISIKFGEVIVDKPKSRQYYRIKRDSSGTIAVWLSRSNSTPSFTVMPDGQVTFNSGVTTKQTVQGVIELLQLELGKGR